MKKLSVALLCLVALLAGCNSDDFADVNQPQSANAKPTYHWFGVKQSDGSTTRGVAQKTNLWGQSTELTIKFLNDPADPAMLDKIKTYAKEWEEHANIKFNFVDRSENAMIRIAFDWDNDWLTWSYTGSDAKVIRNQADPTACFGGLDDYTNDEEIKGAVLRVFGQILGLEYEQRHIGWDDSWWKKDKKGNYLAQLYWESEFSDYYEDFDWETIKTYVFDPLSGSNVIKSEEIDLESVMLYPYTRKETSQPLTNYELSAGDIAFIGLLYPKTNQLPTIQEAWVDAGFFEWRTKENSGSNWKEGMVALKITELGAQQKFLPDVSDGGQLTSTKLMFCLNDAAMSFVGKTVLKRAPMFNASNVTDFSWMFHGCKYLSEVPVYDTSKGIDFYSTFRECVSLTTIPLLDTSNGTSFGDMFRDCDSLITIPLINTSKGTAFGGMFSGCTFLTSIPLIDTSKGERFEWMFMSCHSLTILPPLDTSNGMYFRQMFLGCGALTTISSLDLSNARDVLNLVTHSWLLETANVKGFNNGKMEGHLEFENVVFSVESVQYIIDNALSVGTSTLRLHKMLESKVPASLIAEAKAKNITISFWF